MAAYNGRFALGTRINGGAAVWDLVLNTEVMTFPPGQEGWNQASTYYRNLVSSYTVAQRHDNSNVGGILVVLLLIIVGYVLLHSFFYRSCLFPPDIWSWPRACL